MQEGYVEGYVEIVERTFKKGDAVPEWVEKITPADTGFSLVFGVDVLVQRSQNGVTMYPLREMKEGEYLMVGVGEARGLYICGAPTRVFQYPLGDLRNHSDVSTLPAAVPTTAAKLV